MQYSNDIQVILDFVNDNKTQELLNQSYFSETFSLEDNSNISICPVSNITNNDQLDLTQLTNILSRASYIGNLPVIENCLLRGAKPNLQDDGGRQAFHSAAAGNHPKVIEMLLCSLPDQETRITAINQSDYKGWTPLHVAVCQNNLEATAAVLKAGGDLNAELSHSNAPCRTSLTHSKAIHFSAVKHNSEITRLLLASGATLDDRDCAGRVPLHYASCTTDIAYIKELINLAPHTVSAMDINCRTPLHTAALFGLTEVCLLLVNNGANRKTVDTWDITPANLAFLRGHDETAMMLDSGENKLSTAEPTSITSFTKLCSMEKRVFSLLQSSLKERNEDQLLRCIKKLGTEMCLELFEETLKILEKGGQMTANGQRKKTPGGIFFGCVQAAVKDGRLPVDHWIYIRMTTLEKEKVNKRKNAILRRGNRV